MTAGRLPAAQAPAVAVDPAALANPDVRRALADIFIAIRSRSFVTADTTDRPHGDGNGCSTAERPAASAPGRRVQLSPCLPVDPDRRPA
jgi:hypothetical protein